MSRFLLVRLGALGDIVHAIPVAAALRKAFPSAAIDWLVGAKHRGLLDLVPVIDRRLVIGEQSDGGGAGLLAAVRELRRTRYDVAFDLQGLLKSAILARASGATRVVGFSSAYLRERLARPLYTDVYDPGHGGMYDPRETTHIVQMNLGLLTAIGLTSVTPEFPIAHTESDVATRAQAAGPYALLNPGAGWPNKRWPADRFGQLARTLRERRGLRSIVAWGPGEEPLAQDVVREAGGAASLSPRTNLGELIELIRGASIMVAGDTGPTHLAAAVGTPLVGIYGPTRPSRNGPWAPKDVDVTVSRAAECQCHHLRRCRLSRMCLLDIDAGEVARAVDRRLEHEPVRG